jgi:transcription elongation factor Elf1
LHKTGIKKKRSDYKEPYKCNKCEFVTKNSTTQKIHILNNHSTIEERKQGYKIYCEVCDFGSFYEDSMKIHNASIKHKYNILSSEKNK